MSMEEEQARQAAEERTRQTVSHSSNPPRVDEGPMLELPVPGGHDVNMSQDEEDVDEEEAIARAIEMSMNPDGKDQKKQP